MVKCVFAGWFAPGIILWPIVGAGAAAAVSGSWLIVGLLVVIAVNIQPRTEEHRQAWSVETHETDADLFEDFDDPFEEAEAADQERPRPRVRTNPRRKQSS